MYVESHNESFAWNAGMKIFASVYSKRKYVNRIKRKMLNRLIPENILGKQKQFPKFVEKAYDIESNINNS
jgi:hypothetical protein